MLRVRQGPRHDNAKHGEPQTQRNYSWRDYGNRIGIWRLFDLADELKMPLAHNTNSLLYDYAPQIFEAIRRRGDEIVAHGRTNSENLHDFRWEDDEARVIREVTETFTRTKARRPKAGWGRARAENGTDARPAEGSRLQIHHGLAGRRPADLDAHALGPDPLGAVSGGAQRRADASTASTRRASSAT